MASPVCGFVGLGLIGGSIAKALKAARPHMKIIAWDINEKSLRQALAEGIVNVAAPAIDDSFSSCDYIFLCAPVQKNDENIAAVKRVMNPGCLLTDVGSVKAPVHEAVCAAGLNDRFIGGHPMAGSERTGYANSKAILLENAYYILTPAPSVSPGQLDRFRDLVSEMGAIPLVLDQETHDYVTAAISHLPHVVAASLVNLVQDQDTRDGIMKLVAAGGFRDITRIASSSPLMWQQICLTNGRNISLLLGEYVNALNSFRQDLDRQDAPALYERFENARIYRDSFIKASSGPIKRFWGISVDIADKSGALADVTALLAAEGISIKNIGILHNRESEDGVLSLEFYDEEARNRAAALFAEAGYGINIRS